MATEPIEIYVVRIYRRGRRDSPVLVGLVETPGSGWQKPFRNAEELKAILAAPRSRPPTTVAKGVKR